MVYITSLKWGVCSWFDFTKEKYWNPLAHNSCDIQPCHSNEFPYCIRPAYSVLDQD